MPSGLATTRSFLGTFGRTGVFVVLMLIAEVLLAASMGFRAEAAGIATEQVMCLFGISLFAISKVVSSVVFWRAMVEAIDTKEEEMSDSADKQGVYASLSR
jgi:hypothetical protein